MSERSRAETVDSGDSAHIGHSSRVRLSEDFTSTSIAELRSSAMRMAQVGDSLEARDTRPQKPEQIEKPTILVRPGESIQRALDSAPTGAVIQVAEGVYREKLDIKRDGITLKAQGNVVIDMGGRPVNGPVINIAGRQGVTVDGFEIRNVTGGETPMAIRVDGASRDIRILNNNIHDIKSSKNAHGIGVFGNSTQPIRNIEISGNRVHNLKLGQSEAVVINGNVDGFKITGNTVRDSDNIGIDIIGGEGVGKKGMDRARNGLIANNRVHNIDSLSNPTYKARTAAGIYVDGGSDVTIRDNVITDSNYGIEIASEHRGMNTTRIKVYGNTIERSHLAGISMGGGEKTNGGVTDSSVENNLLIKNKRAIWKQHNVHNVFIGENPER